MKNLNLSGRHYSDHLSLALLLVWSAGIAKEIADSLPGGSGFSFVDMAANQAGIRLAVVVEEDYDVESFLIDGEPPTDGMTRMPGAEVIVTVTFTRNWDVPKHKSTRVVLVGERKESDVLRAGSHSRQYYRDDIPSRPGKIKQTIKATIPLLDAADADRIEKNCLGRYCKLIISEAGSEIVSHKIYIAK